jgi:hypothetical protein
LENVNSTINSRKKIRTKITFQGTCNAAGSKISIKNLKQQEQ